MIIDLSWPWTTGSWFDRYLVPVSAAFVLGAGIIVYFIQRARGVDLSGTIHEIGQSPVDAHRDVVSEYVAQLLGGLTGAQQVARDQPLDAGAAQPLAELVGLPSTGVVQRHLGPALTARRRQVPVGLTVAHHEEAGGWRWAGGPVRPVGHLAPRAR